MAKQQNYLGDLDKEIDKEIDEDLDDLESFLNGIDNDPYGKNPSFSGTGDSVSDEPAMPDNSFLKKETDNAQVIHDWIINGDTKVVLYDNGVVEAKISQTENNGDITNLEVIKKDFTSLINDNISKEIEARASKMANKISSKK